MKTQKKRITTVILTTLALSGCGGGGGGSTPAAPPAPAAPAPIPVTSSPPPNTSLQLWAPYFTINGTTSGSSITYSNLSVDSTINPNDHTLISSVQIFDADNPLTNIQSIDNSGILTPSGSGYIVNGARYFIFSSNGKLYALDLTSQTVPVPVQWGTLAGLTEVCGIQAEQSDDTGQTGAVVVSGVTTGTTPSSCTSPQTWIVPFNTPATTSIPMQAHTFLVTTFINNANGSRSATGFVIGTPSSVNVTPDLTQTGIATNIPYNPTVGDSLASELGGNPSNQFVWVDNTSTRGSTNYLYIVTSNGTTTPVSGNGFPSTNISANTAADENGNLYLVATSGSSGNYTLTVYKVTLTAQVSVIYTQPNITSTTVSSNITINPTGTGGVLTIETGTGNPVQNIVFNVSTGAVFHQFATLANSNSYQFLGLDASGVFNAEDMNNTAQNDVYAVNLGTGATVKSIPNLYLVSPIWGSNFISAANSFYLSYGYMLAPAYKPATQTLAGTVSVVETQNYTTTAAFTLPTGTTSFVPATTSTSSHYIMGTSSGSTDTLFATVPSTNLSAPGAPVNLGTNSSTSTTTVNWYGY